MEQLPTVAEHDEARRLDARLRHVIDLQAAALVRRRLDARLRVGEDVVEHAGGDAHGALVVDKVDELEQPLGALAGQGRDEQHRRVGHEAQVAQDVLAHFFHGAGLFVDQVPLVHNDDGRLARLVREAGDLRVLLRDAVARVDHDQAHIRALDGELGAHDGEFLNAVVHARLAPDAGGIDKDIFAVFVLKAGVDAVARRAGDVADDDALFAEDEVHERGLADVRLADDGDAGVVRVRIVRILGREMLQAGIEQVARAVAVHGGHGDRVAEAEGVKLIDAGVDRAGGVHLVDGQHNGLFRAQEHIGHFLIGGGDAGANLGDEHDDVGRVDGELRLLAHEEQDLIVGARLDAAGIDDIERAAAPLALGIEPVARDAGRVLHDGQAAAAELIEEHGLADVRPAHDRNQGSGHDYPSLWGLYL